MPSHHLSTRSFVVLATLLAAVASACSKQDVPATDSAVALAPAPAADSTSSSADSASRSPAIRGTLTVVTDSTLTLSTAGGNVSVRVVPPLHVFTQAPSDLAHVMSNSFVGVTSVAQPDGSERATEINIFPEEMRGLGEGSRLMTQASGTSGRSTMTNGTVSGSNTANGGASRMTNGTVNVTPAGRILNVTYSGDAQTIMIPAGVKVSAIAPTKSKLLAGTPVIVIVKRSADGGMTSSMVMLAGQGSAPK